MKSILKEAKCCYIPKYIKGEELNQLKLKLNEKEFEAQDLYLFNKKKEEILKFRTNKKSFWYGDYPQAIISKRQITHNNKVYDIPTDYTRNYPFDDIVLTIKDRIEKEFNLSFNSCLVNKYNTPTSKLNYHSDAGPNLGEDPIIASLTLIADKASLFLIKAKDDSELVEICLGDGDLLLMMDKTNLNYLHSLPVDNHRNESNWRINMTFRQYEYGDDEINCKKYI